MAVLRLPRREPDEWQTVRVKRVGCPDLVHRAATLTRARNREWFQRVGVVCVDR